MPREFDRTPGENIAFAKGMSFFEETFAEDVRGFADIPVAVFSGESAQRYAKAEGILVSDTVEEIEAFLDGFNTAMSFTFISLFGGLALQEAS